MAPATTPVAPCRTTRASATRVQVQPLGAAHARAGRPRLSASSSRLSARALGGRALVGLASPASSSVAAAAARRKLSGASGSSFVCLAVAPNQSSSGSSLRPSDDDELGEVLVEVRDVCKSFGSKHVLAGASFQIRRGDRVAIVGPSGTGKSTILKILAGLVNPDSGSVYLRGVQRQGLISDSDNENGGEGLRVGMVFQSAALFDSLTVEQNVGFTLYEHHPHMSKERVRARVTESLRRVGLSGIEERYPSELSGGMRKRVALARAIITSGDAPPPGQSPKSFAELRDSAKKWVDEKVLRSLDGDDDDGDATTVAAAAAAADAQASNGGDEMDEEIILYDEPTAGLDPVSSTLVENLMRDISNECTHILAYVVVTHQASTIRNAADRVIFLHEGRVVWEGRSEEFDTSDVPIVRQFSRGSLDGPIKSA